MSAIGIPDRSDYGDMSKLQIGALLDLVRQQHTARKAGEHEDFRFGNEDVGGLHSWAIRKGMPEPGQKRLAIHQPIHAPSYAAFSGEIKEGYGAGTVKTKDRGKVLLTDVQPGKIGLVVAHQRQPQYLSLIRKGDSKDWLVVNTTPTDAAKYQGGVEKPHYKSRNWPDVEHKLDDYVAQPKADGASQVFRLGPKGVEAFSYRTSKDGRPLIHTERMFGGQRVDVPKELVGTILRGELMGFKGQEKLAHLIKSASVIPPQELGGLLNSSIAKSITDQKEKDIQLRAMLYDIVGFKGTPQERHQRLAQIVEALKTGRFFLPEQAETPEDITNLQQRIAEGKHPLTSEGIMLYPKAGGDPVKVKNTDEHDVIIQSLFPGKKKYHGSHSGGFAYSNEPGGPVVGEVGSGLSDATRAAMHERPDEFVGRTARVRAAKRMPSGALYSPVFLALHEDITQR